MWNGEGYDVIDGEPLDRFAEAMAEAPVEWTLADEAMLDGWYAEYIEDQED